MLYFVKGSTSHQKEPKQTLHSLTVVVCRNPNYAQGWRVKGAHGFSVF